MRSVGKIAACEISFLPLGTADTSELVKRVLAKIEESGLGYSMGDMSTVVKGDRDKIFQLLREIYTDMDGECEFVLLTKISNICGC